MGGDRPRKLTFLAVDSNADEILRAILAQSGRTFRATQEEIGVIEALLVPAIVGAVGGLLLIMLLAEGLGTGGTVAVGVVLLMLVLGWAAARIIRRPQRTVWLPEEA